jgi:hypothetical protein
MALKLFDRGSARRVAVVDAYQFPSGVRQRFGFTHPTMDTNGVTTVESALRQWLRINARHPKARLTMPSVAADAMWRELVLHTNEYAELCAKAFGHEPPVDSVWAGTGLRNAYLLACEDEPVEKPKLPLLFRVDRELAITKGNFYLGDCGGRGQCFDAHAGVRCLQHVAGLERKHTVWQKPDSSNSEQFPNSGGYGCGAGF